jgi:membrane protease YdiL (CAAX protease family)
VTTSTHFHDDMIGFGANRRARRLAALELGAMVAGVLGIMWVVPFTAQPRLWQRIVAGALIVLLVVARWREQSSWRTLGFRFDNFFDVLRRLLPFIAGLCLASLSIGLAAGTVRFGPRSWWVFATSPAWALLQQYLLLAFVHRRLRVVLNSGSRAVLATTAVFAVMHFPNPALTVVCAIGGFVWAREYERSPNLFAHTLTHAIGSAFVAGSLPRELLKNMVVGYRYFTT